MLGGWMPHNPVRPVQPCAGMDTGFSSMAHALSQLLRAAQLPKQTNKKTEENNESKTVSATSRAVPALSANIRRAVAGARD